MTPARGWRLHTTVAVAGLSLFAMTGGLAALRLGLAEIQAEHGAGAASVRPFAEDADVGLFARRDLSRLEANGAPSLQREEATALIGLSPLNSGAWLDLAIARRATGETIEATLAALAMSTTTGANEGWLMAARAEF